MLQPPDRCGAGITPPGGPKLASLGLTGLTSLTPAFDPDTLSYTAASDGTGGTITFDIAGVDDPTHEYPDAILLPGKAEDYDFSGLMDIYAYCEEHSIDPLNLQIHEDSPKYRAAVPELEAGNYCVVLIAGDVVSDGEDFEILGEAEYWIDVTVS